MLLFFRVLRVLVSSFFLPRISVLDESVLRFRVLPTDMDLNRHLNDGRYISLSGLGRLHLLARSDLFRKALKRQWYPVVGAAMIRYRREIPSMKKFTLRTRIIGWDEKWFYFEHRFEMDETLAAIGYVRGVLRTRAGAVPTADVLALAGANVPSPPLPDPIVRWREAGVP